MVSRRATVAATDRDGSRQVRGPASEHLGAGADEIVMYPGGVSFDGSIIRAALTWGIAPLVIPIWFFQQRIISGLTAGGVNR